MSESEIEEILSDSFGACGCSEEDEMVASIIRLMEWHDADCETRPPWSDLYAEPGLFYIMAGILNDLDFAEHGIAIRHPWLTPEGKEFLTALKQTQTEQSA